MGFRSRGCSVTMSLVLSICSWNDPMRETSTMMWRTWRCTVCGFLYREEEGFPEEGIAAGTRWEDVSEEWICPDCGIGKADFEMVIVG